ncbi:g_PROTEIN_RECEP_F2_3 domain-containing protein [Nephila pilipes]|uniref:G_PROTEIN_RECEP_F2_3 domain-containing protein n=1 Tax=Nephila pilipes TaxID=299642 RepID=A0A8X6Q1R4_NEPPI|nr:g_PROTEIN_RECEP_F2_3 domain-containing protein [Nephila pilipes]
MARYRRAKKTSSGDPSATDSLMPELESDAMDEKLDEQSIIGKNMDRTTTTTQTSTMTESTTTSTTETSTLPTSTEVSSTTRSDTCKPVRKRGILWPETPMGETAVESCPGKSTGKARWSCEKGGWGESGPTLRECRSLDIMNLKEKFNTSSIKDTMSMLEQVFSDREKEIFGEDLADVISMMTSLPDRVHIATQSQSSSERWTSTKGLVEKTASLFDRIIELDETWHDIEEQRRPQVGTHLLSTIDGMSLNLADAMDEKIDEQSIIGKNMGKRFSFNLKSEKFHKTIPLLV